MKNFYSLGYARVSTNNQSLEREIKAIKRYRPDIEECNIFTDKCSGEKSERPGLNTLKQKISMLIMEGNTNIEVIITEIDRLGRNKIVIDEQIKWFKDHNIKLRILELDITLQDNSDLINNAILNTMIDMYAMFAAKELEKMKKRMSEGKAIARQNPDFREGRPKKFSQEEIYKAMRLLETKTYKETAKITGISISTLIREHAKYEELQKINYYVEPEEKSNTEINEKIIDVNEETDLLDGYDF